MSCPLRQSKTYGGDWDGTMQVAPASVKFWGGQAFKIPDHLAHPPLPTGRSSLWQQHLFSTCSSLRKTRGVSVSLVVHRSMETLFKKYTQCALLGFSALRACQGESQHSLMRRALWHNPVVLQCWGNERSPPCRLPSVCQEACGGQGGSW